MNIQKLANPFLTVSLLVVLLAGATAYQVAFASSRADDFFRIRSSVFALLKERVTEIPPGVMIVLPPTEASLSGAVRPFPDEGHIRSAIDDGGWQGRGSFQLLLELDQSVLPASGQGNSETIAATVLLNHYFADLEKLGLRRRGSPGVVMGKVQSSRNEWFYDPGEALSVEGTVFVAPELQQAIVICVVRERLLK